MMNLKKLGVAVVLAATLLGSGAMMTACAYGGVASTPDGTVVIVRNDFFLFGLLRKVYVCKNAGAGLTCTETSAP
jgi:hypothetical protein